MASSSRRAPSQSRTRIQRKYFQPEFLNKSMSPTLKGFGEFWVANIRSMVEGTSAYPDLLLHGTTRSAAVLMQLQKTLCISNLM